MEKKSVGLLELETAVLECFLEKTPLSPLGVNDQKFIPSLSPQKGYYTMPFTDAVHALISF
jgi:hypothetical protein